MWSAKKKFFFNFNFLAQIQGAPKSNIKKKVDAWPTVYLWIGKSKKKIKWFLKKEGCLRDNLPHLKKNKKKWRAFEKFIEKMAYFPAVFWVNKILNLYFFGLNMVNCHTGHINKQNPARFFKIGSVVPEVICRLFEKKSFREKRVQSFD